MFWLWGELFVESVHDTIVIGSGIGGLACASALAKYGHRVLVLEQHSSGRRANSNIFPKRIHLGCRYTLSWGNGAGGTGTKKYRLVVRRCNQDGPDWRCLRYYPFPRQLWGAPTSQRGSITCNNEDFGENFIGGRRIQLPLCVIDLLSNSLFWCHQQ